MMKKLLFSMLLLLMTAIGAVAQQSLPYSYGFEDNDLSVDGWTKSNCHESTGISSDAAKTGSYGFRFYYRSNPPQYLISPELTGTANGVQVEFYYKNYSSSYNETFQVGYSTTDNSTGSFTWGDEFTASGQQWILFSENFPSNTKYVSVKLNSDDQFYLFLDDFSFTVPASCIKPSALTASNITNNSVALNWTQNSSTTNWILEYSTSSDFSSATTKNVNGTPSYNLSSLNSTTTYYVRVKADCGGGDESDWCDAISFTTTAVAEEVGDSWSDDFEGASCGWVLVNGDLTNAWAWGSAVNNGGTQALYISNDGGVTNAYTNNSAVMVYATKLLNFAAGKYEFSYDWMANGESTYDYLRVALVPASVTLTAGTSAPSGFGTTALPTGWIALDGGSKLNLVTSWQTKDLAINVTAGNYYLVFAWRDDTSGGAQTPAAIDNVSITRVACAYDVTDLAVSNISTTTAKLTWTAGEASQWQVAYSTSNDFAGATEEIVSEATYNMTSLTSATTYYVKVRAYCGGSDFGAWGSVLEFPTACEAITSYPWNENFDGYAMSSTYTPSSRTLPICWNYINTCSNSSYMYYPTIYYYSYTDYSHSTPNSLRLYSYYSSYGTPDPQPQYAILPQMESLDGKRIVFWARGYNASSTFKIGLMTDPSDASTFVQVGEEQTLTDSYQKFTINLTGTGNYIAIMIDAANSGRTNNGVYIDDITVEEQPTCLAPTALTITSYTSTTATITWTAGASETAWNLRYKGDGDADWTVLNGVENPYTITGLDADTDYEVQVQADCGSGDISEWTDSEEFYTGYCQPAPTSVDNSGITNVTFGTADAIVNNSDSPSSAPFYGNYYNQIGAVQAGVEATVSITYGTGYTYGTIIWIDLNNNLVFDGDEVVYTGVSTNTNPTTLAATFTLPASTPTGDYRMRIAGADSYYDSYTASIAAAANAPSCPTSSYTIVHDYTIRVLAAPSCVTPTALAASSVMARTAVLSWTPGTDETAWQICLNDEEGNLINADSNPFTLTGLTPETTYQVKVRANCGGDGVSEWSANVSFTTTVSCLAPTALAATLTPGNGTIATLSWTENGTATDWVLEYGTEADFAGATSVDVNGTPSADLTGLTAESTYYARVKAACDVDDESAWSSTINFTPTDAYSITLNDGTSTNSYVPVYGLYVDELSRSQFIIPASDLTDLQGATITKLTFYSSDASKNWGVAQFDVRLAEVDNTTIESLEDWDGMSLAYDGSLGISDNLMEVTFDFPYTYQGGNLMIGTNETTSGTYSSCYWYGVSATGSSLGGHDSSISQQNFLPKVTIEYTPGVAPVVNHTITATAGENGTITPNGETLVEDGESQQFTIVPAECYHIASVLVDGEESISNVDENGVYTFTNVTADHTIVASFALNTYEITTSVEGNGTITETSTVNCGDDKQITITPANDCYRIASVLVDGDEAISNVDENGVYTFENVTADHTIVASFALNTYEITASVEGNGTVSETNAVVDCNDPKSFTFTPANDCYRLASVLVDGVEAINDVVDGVYTFTNVTADHNIAATFEQITYTFTVNAGENGTITANDVNGNVANCGEDKSFTIAANEGYSIASVMVDGSDVTDAVIAANGVYTFTNVAEAHTIAATFSINSYNLTIHYVYADDSEAAADYTATLDYGATYSVASPEITGYTANQTMVEGTMPAEDVTVTVTYNVNSYNLTIHYVYADDSEAAADYTATLDYGATYSVASPAITGYTANQTMVEGTMPAEDVTVTVTYNVNSYTLTIHYVYADNSEASADYTESVNYNATYSVVSPLIDGFTADRLVVEGTMGTEDVTETVTYTANPVPTHTLTIHYVYAETNEPAADDYTATLAEGADYSVASPAIDGFTADRLVIEGTMGTEDVTETVTYTANSVQTYTITLTVGEHGTVTATDEDDNEIAIVDGVITVNDDDDLYLVITPEENYQIGELIVDGTPVELEEEDLAGFIFPILGVSSDMAVSVTFVPVSSVEMFEAGSMMVYPNPNNGMFRIDFSNIEGDATYEIINDNGAVVETRDINVMNGETMNFNHDLRPGTYFVRIINGDKVYVEQIVVE